MTGIRGVVASVRAVSRMGPPQPPRAVARRGGPAGSGTATAIGTAAAAAAAWGVDLLAGGHPVHTLLMVGIVAAATACGRRLPRRRGLADLISVAALAQPSLHVAGAWAAPLIPVSDNAAAHHAVPPGTTGIQVVLSVFIVFAVLACGRAAAGITEFVIARRSRTGAVTGCLPEPRPLLVRVSRRGSMLRWCGWTLRAARRGPPTRVAVPTI